jgi:hypothetical protein
LDNHVQSNFSRKGSELHSELLDQQELPTLEEFIREIGRCESIQDAQKIKDTLESGIFEKTAEISTHICKFRWIFFR